MQILKKAAFIAAFFVAATGVTRADAKLDQALLDAARKGDVPAVERLLKAGAKVDAPDELKRTPLMLATQANRVDVARVLIAAGANVNAKDAIEDSPYLSAGAEGRNEILKMTLAAGADLKSLNRFGGTALIPAAHHGYPDTVAILLGTSIDKDHVNKLGWTALLEAVILGEGGGIHTKIVKLLVDAGANVNIADKDGVPPLAHAKQRRYRQIVQILEAANAR
ncbi:MAG: ankyrin repeat domain-containing protein [Pseudolabrys sp.]